MKRVIYVCVLILSLTTSFVHAGVIVSAVSVTSTTGSEINNPIDNLINQSGLNANYVSGVTDFDTFTNSTTASLLTPQQVSAIGGSPSNSAVFDFNLGSLLNTTGMAVWNQVGEASLQAFDLYKSDDGVNFNLFNSDTLPAPTNIFAEPANVFSWSALQTQYIRLVTTDNFGFNTATRFNEVAFRVIPTNSVSAPSFLAVFSLGLLFLKILITKSIFNSRVGKD